MNLLKTFLLIAIISLLNACASSPSSYWAYEYNKTSGSWVTQEVEDELDGNWTRSGVVYDRGFLKGDAYIQVDTYASGNTAVGIRNGDGYICDFDTTVRYKFEDLPVETLYSFHWDLSKDKTTFWLRDNVQGEFLNQLWVYDSVIIETRDGCGTNTQMEFDITGSPHIVTKFVYPE